MPTAFPFHPRSILSSNKHNSRTHVQFPHNSTRIYSSRFGHNPTLLAKTIHIAKQRHPLTHNTALLQQRNVYPSHKTISTTLQHNRFKAALPVVFSSHSTGTSTPHSTLSHSLFITNTLFSRFLSAQSVFSPTDIVVSDGKSTAHTRVAFPPSSVTL